MKPKANDSSKSMDNALEAQIEKLINQVTSSDLFLRSVSTLINFNSYRKIWTQKAFEKILKELELPVRRDQEKLLALVQELEIRLKKLQLNEELREAAPPAKMPTARPRVVAKSSAAKKSPAKRIN